MAPPAPAGALAANLAAPAVMPGSRITGPLRDGTTVRYRRTMSRGQQAALAALLTLILASGASLPWLLATQSRVTSTPAAVVLAIMLTLETVRLASGIPVALLATRACDPVPMRPIPCACRVPRVALLTTIVPSKEPLALVRWTLGAMLAICYAAHPATPGQRLAAVTATAGATAPRHPQLTPID